MNRRRYIVFALAVLLSVQLLTVSVYAATDNDGLLDGIGGFFSDFGDTMIGGLKSIGQFIIDGFQWLFIPRDDYFPRLQQRLFNAFNVKFGSILSLVNHLKTAFGNIQAYKGDLLVLKFPGSHLFGGKSIDLLSGSEQWFGVLRAALSGSVVLLTVAYGYKKVLSMINT